MHNLLSSLGVHSQIVPHHIGVVQSIVSIPESSVRLHPILLLALVAVTLVQVLSTVHQFQPIVSFHHLSSTSAPVIRMQADLDNGLLM